MPYPAFACQVGIFSRRLICAYWHSKGPLAYRVCVYLGILEVLVSASPELTLGTAYREWMEETSS